jgi:hypothetical protein
VARFQRVHVTRRRKSLARRPEAHTEREVTGFVPELLMPPTLDLGRHAALRPVASVHVGKHERAAS